MCTGLCIISSVLDFTTRQVPAVALGILAHGFALHEVFLIQKVA